MSPAAAEVIRPSAGPRRIGKRIKNTLIFLLVRGLALGLGWLPGRVAVALGGLLGGAAYWLAPRERRRALANLERAFPSLSVAARRELARRSARQLGRSALECVVLPRLRARLGGARSPVGFEPGAKEALARATARGRGVLFATAHLGNWELMGAAVAAEVSCPVGVFFRPSYDPRFTRWMEQVRGRAGLISIRVDRPGHLGEAVALLRAGGLLGVMVDLGVERSGVIRVPFLGGVLPSSPLLPILARRTGAMVVVGSIRRSAEDPCQHAISIQVLDESSSELVSSATKRLEAAIRADPIQWTWSLQPSREPRAGTRSMSRGL